LTTPVPGVGEIRNVNNLGTVRTYTDAAGVALPGHIYYPFGKQLNGTQDGERIKYTGHERDLWNTSSSADDLDYMHARHYNPQIARFLQIDPLTGTPGAPQSLNRYAYVLGNPLRWTDPTGLAAPICIPLPVPGIPGAWFVFCIDATDAGGGGSGKSGNNSGGGGGGGWGGTREKVPEGPGRVSDGGQDIVPDVPVDEIPDPPTECPPVLARVVMSDKRNVGRPGGFSGDTVGIIPVRMGTAAIDPAQWGGDKAALRSARDRIFGQTAGGQRFDGISDVVGEDDVPAGFRNIREFFNARFPGTVTIELVGGEDEGVTTVEVSVPEGIPCPTP